MLATDAVSHGRPEEGMVNLLCVKQANVPVPVGISGLQQGEESV